MPSTPRRILLAFHLPEALRDVLAGISDYVKHAGRNWQVECVEPRDFNTAFRNRIADGAITALGPRARSLVRRLAASGAPVVNVLRDLHPHHPSVLSDNPAIGRAGAAYLLQRGFQHFAFVGVDTPWSRQRQSGFTAALAAAGFPSPLTPKRLALPDFEYASRVHAAAILRRWARTLPKPIAVMTAADFISRILLTASQQENLAVPADMAILGVDNFHGVCELAPVPLSSVAQDFLAMGRQAAALLDRRMNAKPLRLAGPILVPPGRLAVRKSTDIFAFHDPIVRSALELIHHHAATGLGMKELLRRIPLSRKWLDHKFKKIVGRTPSEEMRRCRLEHVRDLLTDTDLPLRPIAARCHFSCVQNMVRCFRHAYGISPHAYRRKGRSSRDLPNFTMRLP
jgi:LacI family transcriptional regulator